MDFQTKPYICDYMSKLVPSICKEILEPTPGEGNLVHSLERHGFSVYSPEDFWEVNRCFDAIVMNPPFTPMALGYKILYRAMGMTNHIIALLPWLTIINSQKRTSDVMAFGLRSITHLPRNAFPGARVQTCILDMHRGFIGKCEFKLAPPE